MRLPKAVSGSIYCDMGNSNQTYSDPKELGDRLRSLLLCCQSVMSTAVESLVKAYRFKLKLDISGQGNPGFDLFLKVAEEIGVKCEEKKLPKEFLSEPLVWLSDHSTNNLRAWIPSMKERVGDLHIMLPFCFEYHVGELRKHDPTFAMPEVDNLYLLLIWSECFGAKQLPLGARILRDLLAWESSKLISAYRYRGLVRDEIRTVHAKAMGLTRLAQMYIGFNSGSEGVEMSRKSDLNSHQFNKRTQEFLGAMAVGTDIANVPEFPWLIRSFRWKADQLAVILKNVWGLNTHLIPGSEEDVSKTSACLKLRLQGRTEDEIANLLDFGTQKEYDQWLVGRCIDTDSRCFRRPYNDWLEACDYFGVEPNSGVFESLVGVCTDSVQSPDEKKSEHSDNNEAGLGRFVHSPDYRSLKLPDGRSFALTDRQSQVVALLHDNSKQGTPELSTAFVIEEVYPGVSENRLRRLFDDKYTYDSLIEKGTKRGTVRLKDFTQ